MRTQQEAARAEQQRIKALVLNYDLRAAEGENDDRDGEDSYMILPNPNRRDGLSVQCHRLKPQSPALLGYFRFIG